MLSPLHCLNAVILDVCETVGVQGHKWVTFTKDLDQSNLMSFLKAFHGSVLLSFERRQWVEISHPLTVGTDRQSLVARRFLGPIRDLIWDPRTGAEYSSPHHPEAARCLYQVACFLSKFGSDQITDTMKSSALRQYRDIEIDLGRFDSEYGGAWYVYGHPTHQPAYDDVLRLAQIEVERVLSYARPANGKHGPGATAEYPRCEASVGRKFDWQTPLGFDYSILASFERYATFEDTSLVTEAEEGPAYTYADPFCSRLCFVPKSWDKCRIICAEPAFLQYMQQGLASSMVIAFETCPGCNIRLRDQYQNQVLAIEGSLHHYWCTLDLSAASDRLCCNVLEAFFPEGWYHLLMGARSSRTALPDGENLALRKYGSMGNALTFPVQSLAYWALLVALIRSDRDEGRMSVSEARESVCVYGDDIILPSKYYDRACTLLEYLGLRVNADKSFGAGSFRESCGTHAYRGQVITPSYLRTSECVGLNALSVSATANQLNRSGFRRSSELLFFSLATALKATLPYVFHGKEGRDPVSKREIVIPVDVGVCRNLVGTDDAPLSYVPRTMLEYANLDSHLQHMNGQIGVRTRMSRTFHSQVETFVAREVQSQRRENAFSSWRALATYTAGRGSVRDRGFIPGPVGLFKRPTRTIIVS